jgi:hypothetical protein
MKIDALDHLYSIPQPQSEIQALQDQLSVIAAKWRADKKSEYVKEYHDTYHKLRSLGWNGPTDVDAELPDRLMPQEYLDEIHSTTTAAAD